MQRYPWKVIRIALRDKDYNYDGNSLEELIDAIYNDKKTTPEEKDELCILFMKGEWEQMN